MRRFSGTLVAASLRGVSRGHELSNKAKKLYPVFVRMRVNLGRATC